MRLLRRILLVLLVAVLALGAAMVFFVGPWPVYTDSAFETAAYFNDAKQAIAERAATQALTATPTAFEAGWAEIGLTPPVGTSLAGYGARKGEKRSTGVRDQLYVKAIAVGDAHDNAVIVGSDMLIVPPNLAAAVRAAVARETDLTANDILFNASHTHCGPGNFAPGIAASITGGPYNPEVLSLLVDRFTQAVVEAHNAREPAAFAHTQVDVPALIKNRVRDGGDTDPTLHVALFQQADGDRCILMRYSAHPTIFDDDMYEFSAEYPGELMRAVAEATGGTAVFVSGAVGAMGPRAPAGPDDAARVVAMGEALAKHVLDLVPALEPAGPVDVAAVGLAIAMPPVQLRPFEENPNWRLSPYAARFLGVPDEGWIHGVRLGDAVLVGTPFDFSGELSNEWKAWGANNGYTVWPLSFCGAYCGYLTPKRFYNVTPLDYENGLMGWFGPDTEPYFTALFRQLVTSLTP